MPQSKKNQQTFRQNSKSSKSTFERRGLILEFFQRERGFLEIGLESDQTQHDSLQQPPLFGGGNEVPRYPQTAEYL